MQAAARLHALQLLEGAAGLGCGRCGRGLRRRDGAARARRRRGPDAVPFSLFLALPGATRRRRCFCWVPSAAVAVDVELVGGLREE